MSDSRGIVVNMVAYKKFVYPMKEFGSQYACFRRDIKANINVFFLGFIKINFKNSNFF